MTRHPATYPEVILPVLAGQLKGCRYTLDPFGGTGKLAEIYRFGYTGDLWVNELEPEWADEARRLQDRKLIYCVTQRAAHTLNHAVEMDGRRPDAICTSPVYGNKMSEHCNWKDGRVCHTYKRYIGHDLDHDNAGRFYFWDREYADIHWLAWKNLTDMAPEVIILNTKDFYRMGAIQRVGAWHLMVLGVFGYHLAEHVQVECPGQRQGANHKLRVDHEDVWRLERK